MRRAVVTAVLAASLFAAMSGQTPPVVRIEAITPDPANRLAAGQNLSARVSYESDQPLRFQGAGFISETQRANLANNGSTAYPAGKGEAIVWVFGQPGARINELRVNVFDAKWRQILSVSAPVKAEWHAGIPPAPEAPWVLELNQAQQRLSKEAAKNSGGSLFTSLWSGALAFLAVVAVPGYPLLQLLAWWKLRGPLRLLSSLPLAFMIPVYGICAYAYSQNGNLWPIYMLLASPVALVITGGFYLAGRRAMKRAPA
jgi:hypothetical protein